MIEQKIIENLENDIKLDENFGEKVILKAPDINESVDLHFISFIKSTKMVIYMNWMVEELVLLI